MRATPVLAFSVPLLIVSLCVCVCACVRVMLQWMSKCIGRKNFRYFIVFNVLVACYIAELVVIALCYP